MTPMELRQRSGRDGRALRQRQLAETLALTAPPEPPPPAAPPERAKLDARAIDLQRRELARSVFGENPATDVSGPTRFMAEMLPQEAAPQPTVQPQASPTEIPIVAEPPRSAALTPDQRRAATEGLAAALRQGQETGRLVSVDLMQPPADDLGARPATGQPGVPPPNPNWRGWENVPPEDIRRMLVETRAHGNVDIDNLTPDAQMFGARMVKRFPDVQITSGYRSPGYNASVGGATHSRHMRGDAIDFSGITPENVERVTRGAYEFGARGLGQYGPGGHLHADLGPRRTWGPSGSISSLGRTLPGFQAALASIDGGYVSPRPEINYAGVPNDDYRAPPQRQGPPTAQPQMARAMPAAAVAPPAPQPPAPQQVAASSMASPEPTVMGSTMQAPDRRTAAEEALKRVLMADFSGGAPAAPASSGAPLASAPIQAETARMQPIVGESRGVRPVSFTSDTMTAEGIDRHQALADAMLGRSAGMRDIRHPLQGLAQMTEAGVGAAGQIMAERRAQERQAALAAALMGEGGPDLQALARLDPERAFAIRQQQREQALAQQQAEQERMREANRRAQERSWSMQDDDRDHQQAIELERMRQEGRDNTPADIRTFREVQQMSPEEREAYREHMRTSKAPLVQFNDNGIPERDDVVRGGLAESAVKRYDEIIAAGERARTERDELIMLRQAAENIPGGTVSGLEAWASNTLGLKFAENASDVEVFQAIVAGLAPKQRVEGSGTTTDRDMTLFLQRLPQVMNTPEGNQLILDSLQSVVEYKIQIADLVNDYRFGRNGLGTEEDLVDAINGLGSPLRNFRQWYYENEVLLEVPDGVDPLDWALVPMEERRAYVGLPSVQPDRQAGGRP